MIRYRRWYWALGLAVGLGALALILASDHVADDRAVTAAVTLLLGWSYIGAGLLSWSSRPDNRMGPLMVAEGVAWFASSILWANGSIPFTLGLIISNVPFVLAAQLLLAFPRGRLESRLSQAVVVVLWLDATVMQFLTLLFFDPVDHDFPAEAPANALMVSANRDVHDALAGIGQVIATIAILVAVGIFVQRWRRATRAARRALGPVLITGGLTAALVAVALVLAFFSEDAAGLVILLALVALIAIPFAFVAQLLRSRFARLAVLRLLIDLVQRQAPGRLRDSIARSLRDPSLSVVYWIPEAETYVDAAGHPVELPPPGSARSATVVEREGRRIGALLHDASLDENPELLDAVSAAAGLALENERLQAELRARLADLSESEGRLRALIDASPLAILEVGLDGNVTFWNAAAERLFGWTSEEVVGGPVPFIPEGQGDTLEQLRDVLTSGGSYADAETTRLRKDGSVVDVSVSAAPVRDAQGSVVRFMAAIADITARKRAQEELRHERDFISAVIDTAATLVIVTDREGRFVRFNEACERLTGYTYADVKGRPYWELFIPPDEEARVRAAIDRVWAGDFPNDNENSWVLSDGSRRVIAWSNTVLLDEAGEMEFMVSSGLDVTERKRAEVELRASRARLVEAGDAERRRLERNLHDGAQQRLVALSLAWRMAKAQIRRDPEAAEELLDAAGGELSQALTELRELARGIHPAVLTDRGLAAALETVAARAPAPVDLRIDLDQRLPAPVEAAAYYVISEALANIAKYAHANAISVSIEQTNGTALVEVADDGVGGADPMRGSGLRGLADRVAALDGRLDVESQVGAGTRVRAEIPLGQ